MSQSVSDRDFFISKAPALKYFHIRKCKVWDLRPLYAVLYVCGAALKDDLSF